MKGFHKLVFFNIPLLLIGQVMAETIKVPKDFSTIQAAIDSSIDGDTVLVANGTYFENLDFKGKLIMVSSYFLLDGDTSHISETVINGSQPNDPDKGSVVSFISGEDTLTVLYGFTVTGGTGNLHVWNYGGGIDIWNSSPKIMHNHIVSNTAIRSGGGIYAYRSSPKIINNLIRNNSVGLSGGGIATEFSQSLIINNVVEDNIAEFGGGGIKFQGSGSIKGNVIRSNLTNSHAGGGIYIIGDDRLPIFLDDNIIENNKAVVGGGIYIIFSVIFGKRNSINDNIAEEDGGGLFIEESVAIIKDSIIRGNHSEGNGGGIYLGFQADNKNIAIIKCEITENTALHSGGIYSSSHNGIFLGNLISANSGAISGALDLRQFSSPIIWGNSFYNNFIYSTGVGGITSSEYSEPLIRFNNFSGNGIALMQNVSDGDIDAEMNWWGDSTGPYHHVTNIGGIGDTVSDNVRFFPWLQNEWNFDSGFQVVFPESSLYFQGSNWGVISILNAQPQELIIEELMGLDQPFAFEIDSLNVNSFDVSFINIIVDPNFNEAAGDTLFIKTNFQSHQIELFYDPLTSTFDMPEVILADSPNLYVNFPNPFNPVTAIGYFLPNSGNVTLIVYNLLGEEVARLADGFNQAGEYNTIWNASNVSSGIYFYRLQAGDFVQTRKMILLK